MKGVYGTDPNKISKTNVANVFLETIYKQSLTGDVLNMIKKNINIIKPVHLLVVFKFVYNLVDVVFLNNGDIDWEKIGLKDEVSEWTDGMFDSSQMLTIKDEDFLPKELKGYVSYVPHVKYWQPQSVIDMVVAYVDSLDDENRTINEIWQQGDWDEIVIAAIEDGTYYDPDNFVADFSQCEEVQEYFDAHPEETRTLQEIIDAGDWKDVAVYVLTHHPEKADCDWSGSPKVGKAGSFPKINDKVRSVLLNMDQYRLTHTDFTDFDQYLKELHQQEVKPVIVKDVSVAFSKPDWFTGPYPGVAEKFSKEFHNLSVTDLAYKPLLCDGIASFDGGPIFFVPDIGQYVLTRLQNSFKFKLTGIEYLDDGSTDLTFTPVDSAVTGFSFGVVDGTNNTIVLNYTANKINNYYTGATIIITNSEGIIQERTIESYNASTRVVVVSEDWDENPTSSAYKYSITLRPSIEELFQQATYAGGYVKWNDSLTWSEGNTQLYDSSVPFYDIMSSLTVRLSFKDMDVFQSWNDALSMEYTFPSVDMNGLRYDGAGDMLYSDGSYTFSGDHHFVDDLAITIVAP